MCNCPRWSFVNAKVFKIFLNFRIYKGWTCSPKGRHFLVDSGVSWYLIELNIERKEGISFDNGPPN